MYRLVDSGMWGDPWFEDLGPDAKLLFVYLFTNHRTNAAGAYQISLKAMAHETGLGKDRAVAALSDVAGRVVWWPEHQVVWVRNFYRRQKANDKFRVSARRALDTLPLAVAEAVSRHYPELANGYRPGNIPQPEGTHTHTMGYDAGIDTHADGYASGPPSTDQIRSDQSREESDDECARAGEEPADVLTDEPTPVEEADDAHPPGSGAPPSRPKTAPDPPGFVAFWDAYPVHKERKAAVDQWRRLAPDAETQAAILVAIEAHRLGRDWQRGYAKHPHRWLRDRNWTDEVEPWDPASERAATNGHAPQRPVGAPVANGPGYAVLPTGKPLPEGWRPNRDLLAWAAREGWEPEAVEQVTAEFVARAHDNGRMNADWGAAWKTFLRGYLRPVAQAKGSA